MKRKFLPFVLAATLLIAPAANSAEVNVSSWDELQNAFVDGSSPNLEQDITATIGALGTVSTDTTLNGNNFNISAEKNGNINVNSNVTLNINNVGNVDDQNSTGLSNFISGDGGAIYNDGTVNITNSILSSNKANDGLGAAGGAINNRNILNITNSIFKANSSDDWGGAIYSSNALDIKSSIFSENFANQDGGAINNTGGKLTIEDSSFVNNKANGLGGAIYNNNGTVTINAINNNVEFTENIAGGDSNAIHNNGNTIVKLNATSGNSIIFNDKITSTGGVIEINGESANSEGAIEINNLVSGGTVSLENGTVKFGTYNGNIGEFDQNVNFEYTNGAVSLQNGAIGNVNLGNLTLNATMNLALEADLANKQMDTISLNSFVSNDNNINISNILLLSPTSEKTLSLSPIDASMPSDIKSAISSAIQYTGGDVAYSPIYKYSIDYDPNTGLFNFASLGGNDYQEYNPAILTAPVAAQLGGYLVQLQSYDEAFQNMDMYMLMTKKQRQAMKFRNKYASIANNNIVFDPTISRYENPTGWVRPYATFESVRLDNGPKVSNVAYGSYFGSDSKLYELGNGWDGMFSFYGGYNGSHQAFDGISIYQNGGTLGLSGFAYKGNFFTGLTANVGASAGRGTSMFGDEEFTMLMSGIASKTGYNFELKEGAFIIQPSLLMSYSFVNTFDYKNAAGVSINSDPLHAIQLEPGIKFIGNLKNGWQPYLGVSMVWNIMDNTQFMANDVSLPSLSVDPYVKYGLGVRKTWGERFTGFFQTYITNGGRNGVGLQAGFSWMLGKEPAANKKATGKTPTLEKTKITINNVK